MFKLILEQQQRLKFTYQLVQYSFLVETNSFTLMLLPQKVIKRVSESNQAEGFSPICAFNTVPQHKFKDPGPSMYTSWRDTKGPLQS